MVEHFIDKALYTETESGMKFYYNDFHHRLTNKETGATARPVKSKFVRTYNCEYSLGQTVMVRDFEDMAKYHKVVENKIIVPAHFTEEMQELCGKTFKIKEIYYHKGKIGDPTDVRYILEDFSYRFSNEMLKGVNLVKRF